MVGKMEIKFLILLYLLKTVDSLDIKPLLDSLKNF